MMSLQITMETGRRNQKTEVKTFWMTRYACDPSMNMVRWVHPNCVCVCVGRECEWVCVCGWEVIPC